MLLGTYTIPDERDIEFEFSPEVVEKTSISGWLHREYVVDYLGNHIINKQFNLTIQDLSAADIIYLKSIDGTEVTFYISPTEIYTVSCGFDFYKFDDIDEDDAVHMELIINNSTSNPSLFFWGSRISIVPTPVNADSLFFWGTRIINPM